MICDQTSANHSVHAGVLPACIVSRPPRLAGAGFSLLEVLVALVLGLVLLAGAIGMFISNRRIYDEQQMMSELQENMRYTADTLLYDIRMAGYVGCVNDPDAVQNGIRGTPDWADVSGGTVLEGVEGNGGQKVWQPGNDSSNLGSIVNNTDGIGVRFMQPAGVQLTADMASVSAPVAVSGGGRLSRFEVLAISDCQRAELFAVSNNPSGNSLKHEVSANASANFSKAYGMDAELYRFVARRYLIQNSDGEPALFRYEYAQDVDDTDGDTDTSEFLYHGQSLVSGVENMQLAYRSGSGAFQAANRVTDWGAVDSVRLVLLFRTTHENFQLAQDSNRYTLLGSAADRGYRTAAPQDHRRRRVFSTTVRIRNSNA